MGVQSLSRNYKQPGKSKAKARLAAFCGAILPGLGAVYNRQNFKALVHFVAVVGLFQFRHLHIASGLFGLAGVACYVYSIVDAYRTAQRIAEGESPEADESRFKRQLAKRAPTLGLILIVAGVLLVIQILRPLDFITSARLLPVALIILGGYLLTNYFKRSRQTDSQDDYLRQPPYHLAPDSIREQANGNVTRLSRSGDRR
jgi:TM2 domain-containing membrane protein YozV